MKRYPRCPSAWRRASPSDCSLTAAAGGTSAFSATASPLTGKARKAIALAMMAKPKSAVCQPKFVIRLCPTGASTSVPSDPVAATRPTVWLRFSSGVARDTTPISTPNAVPEVPMPSRNPAMLRPIASFQNTISSMPDA